MSDAHPGYETATYRGTPVGDLQRQTIRTLTVSQVVGGVGTSTGIAIGTVLAEDILGSSDWAGLAQTSQVLGSALLAMAIAWIMSRAGRRPGLAVGYSAAVLGAAVAITASVLRSFPLLLVGTFLFGAGQATSNHARYAAVDLAEPSHRGRQLGLIVWATTIGAVAGPNLFGPGEWAAGKIGLPLLAGPWLFSILALAMAAIWVQRYLRPDPLLVAREVDGIGAGAQPKRTMLDGARTILRSRRARIGLAGHAIGTWLMIAVMVMTPLHMDHGGSDLKLIGLVISIHILGMYAFSPVVGWLVDRFGARNVVIGGALVILVSGVIAGQAPTGWSPGLAIGLFLLGLGWCGTSVAGTALFVSGLGVGGRAQAQGVGDTAVGLGGGAASALASLVVGGPGFGMLCFSCAVIAGLLAAFFAMVTIDEPDAAHPV